MTDVNTEISSDTTIEKWLIPLVVLLVVVLVIILLYKSYTSRGESTDTVKKQEIVTSKRLVDEDQDNAKEGNSNEETRSSEEQPLTAHVDIVGI